METTSKIEIDNIPAILWGEPSDKIYIFVHGKMSSKESAHEFSQIASERGYQVLSFDLQNMVKGKIKTIYAMFGMEYMISKKLEHMYKKIGEK